MSFTWVDGPGGGTPLNAANLNALEGRVAAAGRAATVGELTAALASATVPVVHVVGDINLGTSTVIVPAGKRLAGPGRLVSQTVGPVVELQADTRLTDLEIENTYTASGCVVVALATGASDVHITGCTLLGERGQGVSVDNLGIDNVIIQGNVFRGLTFGVLTNDGANDLQSISIVGNVFTGINGDAIELNHPGSAGVGGTVAYETAKRFVVANNIIDVTAGTFTGSGFGIGIAGANFGTITGNVIVSARTQGIHIEDEARHIVITGNVIRSIGGTGSGDGIHILDGQYITIAGNEISDCAGRGIMSTYDGVDNLGVDYLLITDNRVSGCGSNGIEVGGSGSIVLHQTVRGNHAWNNGGNGILMGGGATDREISGNIARGNTGHGLNIPGNGKGTRVFANTLHGNTAGDLFVGAGSRPLTLRDRDARVSATSDETSYTPWADVFTLGNSAAGILTVTAYRTGFLDYSMRQWRIEWNGTTLTATQLGSVSSGSAGGTSIQMSGSTLQTRVFATAPSVPFDFDVRFDGHIILTS